MVAGFRRAHRYALFSSSLMIASVLLGSLISVASGASDWPRFRGPNGTGISPDQNLPAEVAKDRNVLWSVPVRRGNSSPIVVGGRLFITAHDGDERLALCFSTDEGRLLWQRGVNKVRAEVFNPLNGPATPTPATDGKKVFFFFPEFGLLAIGFDGNEFWRTSLGPFSSIQGLAASPVYVDGKVVLFVDTPEEAYVAAFDAGTGRQVWKTRRPTGVLGSYATPTLYPGEGLATQIVVAGAVELTGYSPFTGERLWWATGATISPMAPPFVSGDSVYTVEPPDQGWPPFDSVIAELDKNKDGKIEVSEAAGDPIWARSLIGIDRNVGNGDGVVTAEEYTKSSSGVTGGGLNRIRIGARDDVTASNVLWRCTKGTPQLSGALLYRNVLYMVRSGIVTTVNPETGELLRQERLRDALGDYYASPVAGDGKIYLASLEGVVTVLEAGADWRVLSTGDLGEHIIATPAISGGRVFIRTAARLYCFASRK